MRVPSSSKDTYTQVSVLPVMLAHTTWPCQDPTPMGEPQVFIREGWRCHDEQVSNLPTTLPNKNFAIATYVALVGQIRLDADGDIICYTLVASVTKRMRVSSSSLVYVKDRNTQVSVLPVMMAHTTWPCQDPTPMGESQVFIREGCSPLSTLLG